MKIRLSIRGVIQLYRLFGKKKDIDLTFAGDTLQDAVKELVRKYGSGVRKAILDDRGEIDIGLKVSVNLTGLLTYGERMNAPLHEGDTLFIMPGG